MNLKLFQAMGQLFRWPWEVKTSINITFVSLQVQATVRSETVAFCMGLGRRAHHSAQQMEIFCLSSASLSTLQTWCFLISFIVIIGKSTGFWNTKPILHISSSHYLTAFGFFSPHKALLLWLHMILFSVNERTKRKNPSSSSGLNFPHLEKNWIFHPCSLITVSLHSREPHVAICIWQRTFQTDTQNQMR